MRDRDEIAMQCFDRIIESAALAEAVDQVISGAEAETAAKAIADVCYAIADAMLAERAK